MKLPAAYRLICTLVLDLVVIATFVPSIASSEEAKGPAAAKPAAAGTDTPESPPPAAAVSRTECERGVAIFSGKKKASSLDDPQLKAAANAAADLVTCGAVVTDSDDLCGLLSVPDECRRMRAVFHEIKTNPKGRSFLMTDEEYENCRKELPKYEMAPSLCDVFREAARLGDPSKCRSDAKGMAEGMEGWCKALVGLDKSKCVAIGGKEDKEQGKEACEKIIDRNARYAKGLDELAKSGSALERALAKAALGQADACKDLETAAMKACVDNIPAPKAAPPQNEAPPPAAPDATPPAAS